LDNQDNTTLILITSHFPYGKGEAFLENEIDFLTDHFDEVIVIARDVKSTGIRTGKKPFKSYRINPTSSIVENLFTMWLLIKKTAKVIDYLREELASLKRQKLMASGKVVRQMIHDLAKALTTASHIEEVIDRHQLNGTVVLYSYWVNNSALAITLVESGKINLKRISRAHGGDIYESRNPLKYLSFRETIVSNTDAIFAISENGRKHLCQKVSEELWTKIKISRLGTFKRGNQPAFQPEVFKFKILTCAFIVEVKRLDLMIDALSQVHVPIEWVHIGDGPLKTGIEEYAARKLREKNNVTYHFIGSLSNAALLEYYQQHFIHVFMNTSSSEGIPVTIMEAQSFGIPAIAAAVGGIGEIVTNENGILLPADAKAADFANAILQLIGYSKDHYNKLRMNALASWQERYNAEQNFSNFVAQIDTL
jgi:glycosyltransferase involved in cell wall biosynthesis